MLTIKNLIFYLKKKSLMFIIFTCTPWHTKGLYLWILLRSSLKLLILSSLVRKLSHSNLIAAWKMEMNKTQKILNLEWNEMSLTLSLKLGRLYDFSLVKSKFDLCAIEILINLSAKRARISSIHSVQSKVSNSSFS